MSGKYLRDVVTAFALSVLNFIVISFTRGFLFYVAWNFVIPKMFGFNRLTVIQAVILVTAIVSFKDNFAYDKEHLGMLDFIFRNLIRAILLQYSWNTILPGLLNLSLTYINLWEAVAFTFVFWVLFSVDSSNEEKK